MSEPERRRRRLRRHPIRDSDTESRSALTADVHDPLPVTTSGEDRDLEHGLRGLLGSNRSQLSIGAALRARDASRPAESHLAEAEERVVLVRRNWVPRDGR
jgi:hypothetical protein